MATKEQKELEDLLASTNTHKNKQTFSADSSVAIYETIDTPMVSLRSRIGCLISSIRVAPQWNTAGNAPFSYWKTMICGGTQTGFLDFDDQKYIAHRELRQHTSAAGCDAPTYWPLEILPTPMPIIVVNPKITIVHVSTNLPDLASENVFTFIEYTPVELTLDMFNRLMADQMDLS